MEWPKTAGRCRSSAVITFAMSCAWSVTLYPCSGAADCPWPRASTMMTSYSAWSARATGVQHRPSSEKPCASTTGGFAPPSACGNGGEARSVSMLPGAKVPCVSPPMSVATTGSNSIRPCRAAAIGTRMRPTWHGA
jgi:hypothetical protein